jgi:hypothetical protein
MSTKDLIGVVQGFVAKWNEGNEQEILDSVTHDVVIRVTPPLPLLRAAYTGKEGVRELARILLPGFHGEASDLQASGDTVTWRFTITSDELQRRGFAPLSGRADTSIQDGFIQSLHLKLDDETVQRLPTSAAAVAQGPAGEAGFGPAQG